MAGNKMQKISSGFVFIVLFSMLLSAAAPDLPLDMERFRIMYYFSEYNFFDGRMILRHAEEIKLTAEQQRKVESLLLSFEETSIQKNAEIKIRELRFAARVKESNVDRGQVEKILRDITATKTDLVIAYIGYLFDLKKILTPPQIQKLSEIRDKIKAAMKERHKNGHRSTTRNDEPQQQ